MEFYRYPFRLPEGLPLSCKGPDQRYYCQVQGCGDVSRSEYLARKHLEARHGPDQGFHQVRSGV